MSARAVSNSRRALLIALVLAGAGLRFATLGTQGFWLDETATANLMRLDFGAMLRAIVHSESTPPLYDVLAWLWTRPFGVSEIGLRSLSAVVGTATIVVVYAAARTWLDRRAALAAAALTAFSPLLVWYSQEARGYALLVLLVAATLVALPEALEHGGRALGIWALLGAGALATHYFAVFLIAPQAVWLLWRRGVGAVAAVGLPVLVGGALLPLALHQRAQGNAHFIAERSLAHRVLQIAKQIVVGYDAPAGPFLAALAAALSAGLVVAALRRRSLPPAIGGLVILSATGLLLPVIVALAGPDYVLTRNVIALWVPVALIGGGLAGTLGRGPLVVAGLCAIGLAVVVGVDANVRYQRDDWRAAAHALPRTARTALIVTPGSGKLPIQYYGPHVVAFPSGGTSVAFVELIAFGRRTGGSGVSAPRLATRPPALRGFGAPTIQRRPTYVVVRYRAMASAGVSVGLVLLGGLDLTRTPPAFLLAG